MRKGDIYMVELKLVYKNMLAGFRPCIIVSNNKQNIYAENVMVVPITSTMKRYDLPTHIVVKDGLDHEGMACVEQVTTLDKTQVHQYMGTLNDQKMREINQALLVAIGLI